MGKLTAKQVMAYSKADPKNIQMVKGYTLRPQTGLALLDDPLHHSQRKTRSNLGAISFNVIGRRKNCCCLFSKRST